MNPTDSCEVFEEVTIVFSDVPDFMDICSKCDPFQIVNLLNTMFGLFDYLSDENDIYKLETVKDSFVGVSGAPERIKNHADKIIDMALDMRDCVTFVQDPRLKGNGGKGPFKYYVIKEVGGWGQKMAILDDLQYCEPSKSWVGGPKKVKNMMK